MPERRRATTGEQIRFRVFGDIAAYVDGRRVEMGSTRERCLLVALLLKNGQRVPREDLTSWIWDSEPNNHHGEIERFMTNLRRRLADVDLAGSLVNKDGLCQLDLPADLVDVWRFRRLVAQARDADSASAAALLAEALDLSEGVPLAGVHNLRIDSVRHTLAEERHGAEITFLRAELQLGHLVDRTADALRLFTERQDDAAATELAMRAFHLAGRQIDALNVYKRHNDLLKESGLLPSRSVRELYTSIVKDDDTLQPPAQPLAIGDPDLGVNQVSSVELECTGDMPAPPAEAREALDTRHVVVLVGAPDHCRMTALRLLRDRSRQDGLIVFDVCKTWTRPTVQAMPAPQDNRGYLLTLNDIATDHASTAFVEDLSAYSGRLADRDSYLVVITRPELWQDCWHAAGDITTPLARPADAAVPEREHLLLTDPDGKKSIYPLRDGRVPRGQVRLGRAVPDDPDPDIVLDRGNSSQSAGATHS